MHLMILPIIGLFLAGLAPRAAGAESGEGNERTPVYSEQGYYRVALYPVDGHAPVAKLHNWIIHVETADGSTFVPSQLVVNGGMPGHGHGLPSTPRVTRYLETGDFLIEGMKFNMGGTWQLIVGLTGPAGPDQVIVDYDIQRPVNSMSAAASTWSVAEIAIMQSLSLQSATAPPRDPSNRFSRNGIAADLGERLFFDPGLSRDGDVACATCHKPNRRFADEARFSVGSAPTRRNTPGLLGAAHHRWFYWDGRRDSLWAQAVTPIETNGEMDNTRLGALHYIAARSEYVDFLQRLEIALPEMNDLRRFPAQAGPFGTPEQRQRWQAMSSTDRDAANQAFADLGKVIAAYVETLDHRPSRFDLFVDEVSAENFDAANEILDSDERSGLRLFLDVSRTLCLRCHNGPMLTNFGFHNIGTGEDAQGLPDFGRMLGLQAALVNEFNCMGPYSDARREECRELIHAAEQHSDQGAFKVPGLRDVAETAPFMHDGRFDDLRAVMEFYVNGPDAESGPSEITPIELDELEIDQIIAFLQTLSGVD